ncbi:MAG: tRNA(His) guanylyltransferase Thg1 family protein [Candidatus Geothermarchaeales archaeon]
MKFYVDTSRYQAWEIYSKEAVSAPVIIRLDGNDFHALTSRCGLYEPFDERFHSAMVGTVKDLMTETGLQITLAYTASDEINVLFLRDAHLPHSGRVEKILSLLPSYATSSFQSRLLSFAEFERPISFDARVVKVNRGEEVVEYFRWRAHAVFRNFINAYAQRLIGEERCRGMKGNQIVNELSTLGFNIHEAPGWQRYGTMVYWKIVERAGYNPLTNERVTVKRRKLSVDEIDLTSVEGEKWLRSQIDALYYG